MGFKHQLQFKTTMSDSIDFFHRTRWWRSGSKFEWEHSTTERWNMARGTDWDMIGANSRSHMQGPATDSKSAAPTKITSLETFSSKPDTPCPLQDHSAALDLMPEIYGITSSMSFATWVSWPFLAVCWPWFGSKFVNLGPSPSNRSLRKSLQEQIFWSWRVVGLSVN